MAATLPLTVLIHTVALSLANYLLVYLLVRTNGPFDVFLKMRQMGGVEMVTYFNEMGEEYQQPESDGSFTADILSCHVCATPYLALITVLIAVTSNVYPPHPSILILWLAVSGGTLYLFNGHDD